jgi:hypothetical protein
VLADFKRKSNIAAAIFLLSLLGAAAWMGTHPGQNLYVDGGLLGMVLGVTLTVSWFYAVWAYVKAKGRSGWWTLAGFAGFIGLIILLFLKDHTTAGASMPAGTQPGPPAA